MASVWVLINIQIEMIACVIFAVYGWKNGVDQSEDCRYSYNVISSNWYTGVASFAYRGP